MTNNVLIGPDCTSSHKNCVVIGSNLTTTKDNQILIGNKEITLSGELSEQQLQVIIDTVRSVIM